MLNTKPPPVSAATITEFFKIVEFMQDKKAVSAALAQEAQEAAAKMEQARSLEREAAVRVEALQHKANSLAKREAELHRREAAALDEEERLNKRREVHGLVKNSLDARETALNTKELGVKVRQIMTAPGYER